jgi:hypothetical protein
MSATMNFPSLLSFRSILKTLIYSLLIYKFGNLNYATLAAFIERFIEFTKIHGKLVTNNYYTR